MKRRPTKLQRKTIAILRDDPDMPVGRAMREAGYSAKTALNPKSDFLDLKGTAVAIEQWRKALRGSGLDERRLLNKYNEWLDATKIKSSLTEPDQIVPDYETQLKVKDDLRMDLGLPTQKQSPVLQQFNIGGEMGIKFISSEDAEGNT